MRFSLRLMWRIVLCVLTGTAMPVGAHDLGLSGIRVLYRPHDVVVSVTTPISRLCRAEGKASLSSGELDQAVRRRLHIRFGGTVLTVKTAHVIDDSTADMLSLQTTLPGTVEDCKVTARLYPEDVNSRMVVIFVRDGQTFRQALLDAAHPDLPICGVVSRQ